MATFYIGPRPILRGRLESELADSFLQGTVGDKALNKKYHQGRGSKAPRLQSPVGRYSFYYNFGPGLLTGAPDHNHVPGSGRSPGDIEMSRWFLGLDVQRFKTSLKNPGLGPRLAYAGGRFRPWEYKGLAEARVFPVGVAWGHAFRDPKRLLFTWSEWSNWFYAGLDIARAMGTESSLGHVLRDIGTHGAPATFGYFSPYLFHGVAPSQAMPDASLGQALPADFNADPYGHNRVLEWHGVPSAQAL